MITLSFDLNAVYSNVSVTDNGQPIEDLNALRIKIGYFIDALIYDSFNSTLIVLGVHKKSKLIPAFSIFFFFLCISSLLYTVVLML